MNSEQAVVELSHARLLEAIKSTKGKTPISTVGACTDFLLDEQFLPYRTISLQGWVHSNPDSFPDRKQVGTELVGVYIVTAQQQGYFYAWECDLSLGLPRYSNAEEVVGYFQHDMFWLPAEGKRNMDMQVVDINGGIQER